MGGPRRSRSRRDHRPADATTTSDAGTLAQNLLDDGFTAMKIWPFDPISQRSGGRIISAANLRERLRPVEQIRDAVGDDIEIMIEGHGYWQLAPAIKIARELEQFRPAWLEDFVLAHRTGELRRLRESTPHRCRSASSS